MADRHLIRNGLIVTVVGGIILAALGKLWLPASRLLAWIWGGLSSAVSIPVWLIVLLAAALAAFAVPYLRRKVRSQTEFSSASDSDSGAAGHLPTALLPKELSGLDKEVFARIAKDDGEAVPRDTVKRSLGATNLRLQAAVDRLVEAKLIEELESVDDPEDVVLLLTPKGRQYAVQHNLDSVRH